MDANVANEVYAKAFFTKLAAAGIHVDNEETAANLLELAQKTRLLKTAAAKRKTKSVAELAKTANASLDRILGGDFALDSLVKVAAKLGNKGKGKPGSKGK
jgi:hypothetical protein